MKQEEFSKILISSFPFETTSGQRILFTKLSEFILNKNADQIFVLKGYAGTGKTTIVRSLVQSLPAVNGKTVLLAPTGRAAKVLSNYTGKQAYTIHMLFIGDTAQLPPVGLDVSPALDIEFLKASFYFQIDWYELTEVVRQSEASGILTNATFIRDQIKNSSGSKPHFQVNSFKDIIRLGGDELEDALNSTYSKYGAEETMVICRSNKRANIFNQQIRARIRWQENELSAGDYMMVVKNNYFWLPEESKAGFIANGDIIELMSIGKIQEMHGFRFADVRMRLIDYPDEPELETRLILDTIMSEAPALSQQDNKRLYESVSMDYNDIPDKRLRLKKVKEDGFFNALQVKFAYAVTCHKAQGGQWPCVFVEQGYLTDEMINTEYLRWLYTAVSRASEKLYLVNFNKDFFE
ncbi:MAG: ATP-dependent helicase [Bacteroidetes bacterium]|nr:ATP-dependent helicase [Bacteroidota bacterium]